VGRIKLFIPLIIFAVLAAVFYAVLQQEDYDPQALPSALVGQAMPEFQLETLEVNNQQANVITQKSLLGDVYLLNVWATWCISCKVEHPYLNKLAEQGVKIIGLNYKDDRAKAIDWLNKLGNPYKTVIYDPEGILGLDLGVYGAPETYLVDKAGVIRFKFVGIVDDKVWQEKFLSQYNELNH
jgi:cytochrome c biogenesis protein CcmG/thiol:disulfide interchange protein DsbE